MSARVVLMSHGSARSSQIAHLAAALHEMEGDSAAAPAIDFGHVDADGDTASVVAACQGAVALLANANCTNLVEIARQLPDLRLVQTFTAGTDWVDVGGLAELGVKVADNGGANAIAVAETAIALMVSVFHRLDQQFASVQAGAWGSQVPGSGGDFQTLEGKRVGLVGLGRIGSRAARRLAGWECDILFHDIADLAPDYITASGARQVTFEELLATSDVRVIAYSAQPPYPSSDLCS